MNYFKWMCDDKACAVIASPDAESAAAELSDREDVDVFPDDLVQIDVNEYLDLDDELSKGPWEVVKTKQVQDVDGFWTDYTLWYNYEDDLYVCVFGDKDLYLPDNGYWDWEGETLEEAEEWFDSYTGFEEEVEDIEMSQNIEAASEQTDVDYRLPWIKTKLEECLNYIDELKSEDTDIDLEMGLENVRHFIEYAIKAYEYEFNGVMPTYNK